MKANVPNVKNDRILQVEVDDIFTLYLNLSVGAAKELDNMGFGGKETSPEKVAKEDVSEDDAPAEVVEAQEDSLDDLIRMVYILQKHGAIYMNAKGRITNPDSFSEIPVFTEEEIAAIVQPEDAECILNMVSSAMAKGSKTEVEAKPKKAPAGQRKAK